MYYKVIISYHRRRKSREGRYLIYGRSMLIRPTGISEGRPLRKGIEEDEGKSEGCWGREHFRKQERRLLVALEDYLSNTFYFKE